jgi:hypothetical protein
MAEQFHVNYQTVLYEGTSDEVFDTIEEVIDFLNKHAGNPNFMFSVIKGEVIDFEAATTVKTYRVKERGR